MRFKTLLIVVAATILLCAPTFGQNLLTNGSFQNGSFSGWTTGGNFEDTEVVSGPFYDYSGSQDSDGFYAVLGPVGSDGTLSQSFHDTAGQQLTFSFWFASVGDNPSDFSASFDGQVELSLTNPNTGANYTQFSFTATGTGNDTITFSFRDDPAYMALDNVSVTESGLQTVPEPSSFLLLGSGVLGLAGVIRRKLRG